MNEKFRTIGLDTEDKITEFIDYIDVATASRAVRKLYYQRPHPMSRHFYYFFSYFFVYYYKKIDVGANRSFTTTSIALFLL